MKPRKFTLFAVLLVILLGGPMIFSSCATVGIEKLQYDVVQKDGSFQIRQYDPYLVAETRVNADFTDSGNVAFRRLFDYISGANRSDQKIAMTAPVNQQPVSEKIAMTAPVTQQAAGGEYAVRFVMPDKYTLETLPQPTNEQVVVKEIDGYQAAVVRYSGTWSKKRYEAKKTALEEWMAQQNLTAAGEPIWARYDPPFTLWFLRRNEVIIPVASQ